MNSSAMRNALTVVLGVLVAVLLVSVGFLGRVALEDDAATVASVAPTAAAPVEESEIDFGVLDEILEILHRDFVEAEQIDDRLLYEGAIQGLFDALNDPHSTYINPETYAVSRNDFSGAFFGIGATVSRQDNYVVIMAPMPDTPAERAGLQAGDILLEVDGDDAVGWSVPQAVLRIRGPLGTSIELLVRHPDGVEERVVIERGEILVASVDALPPGGVLKDAEDQIADDIGYIRIRTFTRRTPDELSEAIREAVERGVGGLILDVRGNPGGLLVETAQTADLFLDGGTILVQVDRAGGEREFAARPGTITDLPIVIVQDQFSASGSEVLAAALAENDRATVVGTTSFGKGTVNNVRELNNGGAVYVSVARWLTPLRNLIEGRGITPDVEVALTADDIEAQRDISLFRAIDILRAEAG